MTLTSPRPRVAAAPLALAAALLAGLLSDARAQAPTDLIEIPEHKSMPKAFLPTPVRDACEPALKPNDPPPPPWRVWIAVKHLRPRSRDAMDAKPVVGLDEFAYLDACGVLLESQGQGGGKARHEFLLVGQFAGDGKSLSRPLGWVPRDFVIEANKALVAQANCIPIKTMIVNDPKRAETLLDEKGEFQRAVWTLSVPSEPTSEKERADYRLGQYSLFNIFWVYARSPAGRVTPEGQTTQDNAYLLLGSSPSIEVNLGTRTDNVKEVIIGWVPESRTIPWLTREAIAWDQASTMPEANPRRTKPGEVFETAADAWAAFYPEEFTSYLGKPVPSKIQRPMVETFVTYEDYQRSVAESKGAKGREVNAPAPSLAAGDKVSLGYEPHHMRFPALPAARRPVSDEPKLPSTAKNGNLLYRIGAIGGTTNQSQTQIDDLKKKIEEVGKLLTSTEILFVIDDTLSMGQHFPDVADAVAEIVADAQAGVAKLGKDGKGGPTVKLAVAYYNDIDEKDPGHKPFEVMKLQAADQLAGDFADRVRNHAEFHGGGLPREMVFEGLQQAISGAFFSTYARKLVVLIGDMGDKSNDPTLPQLTSHFFRPNSDTPTEFISVQVVPPERSADARTFADQMAALTRILNENRGSSKRTLGTNLVLGRDDLAKVISRSYEGLKTDAERMRLQVEAVRMGKSSTTLDEDFKNVIRRKVPEAARLLDPKPGETEADLQGFNLGHVWKYPKGQENRVSQTREVVLLNRAEIQELVNALKPVVNFKATNDRRKQPSKEVVRKLIQDLVGEGKSADVSFEKATLQRLGLQVHSDLLRYPLNRASIDLDWQVVENLAAKIDRLNDILNDKERDWTTRTVKEDKGDFIVHIKGDTIYDRPRGFTIPGGTTKYYWLDVQDEVP